jgi:D-glycerate 3-kinase
VSKELAKQFWYLLTLPIDIPSFRPSHTIKVSIIQSTLQSPPHNLATIVFSLDDLYLTHADQVSLADSHADNPLLQHRGQPSTHDIPLALSVFSSLSTTKPTKIPQYDKSAFSGQGDRVPESEWEPVNTATSPSSTIKVVLFEGWAVGFRPLPPSILRQKWDVASEAARSDPNYNGRLGHNTLSSVQDINTALESYNQITDQLDAFIHIDTEDLQYVYKWRLDQEVDLRKKRGSGMTDEQVRHFIDGYYPSYELFTETLRAGVFGADKGRQLRLVVGPDRKVVKVERL